MSLVFWLAADQGPVRCEVTGQEAVFFIEAARLKEAEKLLSPRVSWRAAPLNLHSFGKRPVLACYFASQRQLGAARALLREAGIQTYEADVRPTDRYLMERFIKGTVEVSGLAVRKQGFVELVNPVMRPASYEPSLRIASLDIETSVSTQSLLSIAIHITGQGGSEKKVFMLGAPVPDAGDHVTFEPSEVALLEAFHAWFAQQDPDLIIGWNLVGFDLKYLQDRCDHLGIPFRLGRGGAPISWRLLGRGQERLYALAPGRGLLDGIEMLRTATWRFESYSLENVARQLLGRGKLIHDVEARAQEIEQLHQQDKASLAAYNLEDCVLVSDIFERAGLIEFAVQRSRLTGLELERQGGSVAAFDYLYLPKLHRSGYVAPVVEDGSEAGGPGGYVLDSKPGLYRHLVVLDFKSLYPSIIRTFRVDPLAMIYEDDDRVPGFRGASFSRHQALLPGIIEQLWAARDAAKAGKREAESQAIKIIMNSFYGVLGTPGCRFFDSRLVSSITLRGHEILQRTRDLIEAKGYPVIYGDTDSVFVLMQEVADPDAEATELTAYLNAWWQQHLMDAYRLPCHLELQFETHFERFLMPRVRGSEKGSKKRYAGLVAGSGELIFKGLETVRSDWSPLAREFQQTLYRRLFQDEPLEPYIKQLVQQVEAGAMDDKLVLRRRLRRPLSQYTKNVPPHVKAAKRADEIRAAKGMAPAFKRGGWVEYVMTQAGPEPRQYASAPLDYAFYIERQLAPIADAVLVFRGTSLAELNDSQLPLF